MTLELDGHGTPIPAFVSIPNKGIDVQSFVQAAEFYIGVREADLQTENPWAAFNVLQFGRPIGSSYALLIDILPFNALGVRS